MTIFTADHLLIYHVDTYESKKGAVMQQNLLQ